MSSENENIFAQSQKTSFNFSSKNQQHEIIKSGKLFFSFHTSKHQLVRMIDNNFSSAKFSLFCILTHSSGGRKMFKYFQHNIIPFIYIFCVYLQTSTKDFSFLELLLTFLTNIHTYISQYLLLLFTKTAAASKLPELL